MKTSYLFLYTIGPVQSFIAQARKTTDMYAGSRLLSQLIDFGIASATDEFGNDSKLIFPHQQTTSKPNRFLMKISSDKDRDELKKAFAKIDQKVKAKLVDIAEVSLADLKDIDEAVFFTQIAEHLETYYIAEQITGSDYSEAYRLGEQKLGAIKNVRPFVFTGEKGKKCSLSGERNGIIAKANYKGSQFRLGDKEVLSAISYVKRSLPAISFPSTAEIASLPFFRAIADQKENVRKQLGGEYQLLYPENQNLDYLKKNEVKESINIVALKDAISQATKLNPSATLSSYYAILKFDGDNMGQWLSGQQANQQRFVKSELLEEFHSQLAELLASYGNWAKDYFDTQGKSIYVGGDDFIGFIPLASLLAVLVELRTSFKSMVADKIGSHFFIDSDNHKELTFSAGVAIAQYKSPLGMVIKSAHQAEHAAKEMLGKDSVCIFINKGSGNSEQVKFSWIKNGKNTISLVAQLNEQLKLYFSNNFLAKVEQRAKQIGGVFPSDTYFKAQLKYQLTRSYIHEDKAKKVKVVEETMNIFGELFEAIPYNESDKQILMDTISLIQFIQRNQ